MVTMVMIAMIMITEAKLRWGPNFVKMGTHRGPNFEWWSLKQVALSLNGSLFRDPGPYRDLFGVLGPYWISIYISRSLFSVFWLHSREECLIQSTCIQQWVILICLWWVMTCTVIIHICCEVMLHTLAILPNFDFYLCLRVKFHKSLFWVPILAAGGPYWVPISQKAGSLFQSLGVPISSGDSALPLRKERHYT